MLMILFATVAPLLGLGFLLGAERLERGLDSHPRTR